MKNCKFLIVFLLFSFVVAAQNDDDFSVIAYYTGDDKLIDAYDVKKLTHVIYSFCHLKEGKLNVDTAKDSAAIKHLVSLKSINPKLKVMLSLGGWGGCEPCSDGFNSPEKIAVFAKSVKEVNDYFKCDGLDLDWEYPSIEGFPGHKFQPEDKSNFTALVVALRNALGPKNELSFAAGGFMKYLKEAVDWKAIIPLVDRVNIMSYDLVNGYATVTGHHTPLYSVKNEEESTDKAVGYLLKLGVPSNKLVIGAAFYTRIWKNVPKVNNGLYQSGVATNGINFKDFETKLTKNKGWKYFWDEKAQAPYWYNENEQLFATGDDEKSVSAKTRYVIKKKLGGIMFWELILDKNQNGLVDAIYKVKQTN
ncbi:glycoside hydrolase family 18 protein [Flavobacterium succinicans]|uniref:chitinase n=1 Tax=Flavobacterium succinicans TaxID=29536 RepID=A0A199XV27_9FLAO|nr:glycoside hydrolase family 18 protein [Flavobacterium succinicans]OAZ05169.1 chitinase A1 precursor [Flavobacterium succinicans]